MDLRLRHGDLFYQVHGVRGAEGVVLHVRRHGEGEDGEGPGAALPFDVRRLGDGEFVVDSDTGPRRGYAVRNGDEIWVELSGVTFRLEIERAGRSRRSGAGPAVASPMPGQVLRTVVEIGDRVEKGQTLLVVEAMKMQIEIAAPHAGVVRQLPFGAGTKIDAGIPLAEVEADSAESGT